MRLDAQLVCLSALLSALCLATAACTSSPLGRSQLVLYPESEMVAMGNTAYQEMRTKTPPASDGRQTDYVNCVAQGLLKGNANLAKSRWTVTLFKGEEANAFALPGGNLGVYEGMLKVANNQHQLAAVIGHEFAHVEARHANERVSTSSLTQTGMQLATVAAGAPSPAKQQLFGLLGLGAQVGVLLPFSRAQESEADLIGLDYMANAGFDPRQSTVLWQNMAQANQSSSPVFLSTHPDPAGRIRELSARMDSAMVLYQAAQRAGRRPNCG